MKARWGKSLAVISLLLSVLAFQNCTPQQFDEEKKPTLDKSWSGTPYEGKLYSNFDIGCPQGLGLKSQIQYVNPTSAILLYDNCQQLQPPINLTPAEFSVDPANTDVIVYNNQTFVAEQKQNTVIDLVQNAERYVTDGSATISLPGMSSPGSGNLVICAYSYQISIGSDYVASVTDSSGSIFQKAAEVRGSGGGDWSTAVYYLENAQVPAGNYSVTAQLSFPAVPGQGRGVACFEYSGIVPTQSLERVIDSRGQGTPQGTAVISPITNISERALIFAAVDSDGVTTSVGYTRRSNMNNNGYMDRFVYTPTSSPISSEIYDVWRAVVLIFRAR